MPLFKNPNKPNLNKSELPKKSEPNMPPKTMPRDNSLFHGGSTVYRGPLVRSLMRDSALREGLRRDPDLRLKNQKEVSEEIKKLAKRALPPRYESGGFTKGEINTEIVGRGGLTEYWDEKHKVIEESKDGFTLEEIRERNKRRKETQILKRWFGLGKK